MTSTPTRWLTILTVLALCTMMGCQGFSTPNGVQPPDAGQLSAMPASMEFGSVVAGQSETQFATVTNVGGSSVAVTDATVTGSGFSISGLTLPLTLSAGQSVSFNVTFSPKAVGSTSGSIAITSDASNSTLTIDLSGTGTGVGGAGQLSVNPATISVGNVVVGSSGTASGTLNASGASVTVTAASSNNARFTLSGLSLPVTIAAGQSKSFTVTFSPQAAGAATATLTFTSDASPSTTTSSATGTGIAATGQLSVTPATINVGNVVVGSSGTASGSLNATGASVTVTAATSNNSRFTLGGLSLPVTIAAGQSASFTVTFSPQVTGAASATLTFTSNASPSTTTGLATGTGTPAPVHSVNLSWNASSSPDVVGYNIYRAAFGTSCGSYAKLNSNLNTSTFFTDSSVTDGLTYCYATTAVDSSDQESVFSNSVQATIPSP